jgi:ABC-type nickel/cobalt efflux system permease component RcnA
VKYLWAILGLLYAVLNVYVAYLLVTAGTGVRLSQKGLLLQAPPVLGGIALALLALPLIWNCLRLVTARSERP